MATTTESKDLVPNEIAVDSKDLGYDKVVPVLDGSTTEDADAFLRAHGAVQTYDAAARKKLVRKIDMHLMPLMCVSYCLQVRSVPVHH
jgi:hypothetical protein